jgi:hypothetical protein
MKDRKFLFAVRIYIIGISLALVGCTATSPVFTPTKEPVSLVNTIVASPLPPTQTLLPATQLPSATPSLTPIPTNTLTPTPTIQPTVTETPYAIPTPPGTNVDEQVLWLLEMNNNCQLPCWWGITPGQTTWDSAEQFFNTFVSNIQAVSSPQLVNYSPVIPLPSEIYEIGNTYASNAYPVYTVRNGIVEEIITEVSIGDTPSGYLTPYILSTFLTTYGQPSAVWLFTYSSPFEENDLPFVVALAYPEKGIIGLYSDNGIRQGDLVHGCPQEDPVSILKLWSPNLNLAFEQIKSGSSAIGADREYLTLEEATGMDVTTFYEIFKNPDNTTCLETPANLWR